MKHQMDFTQGSIWRQLLTFSLPIMATNLLQVSYQLIDSLWVGNLIGATALGAVALSSTVIFVILSFVIGINGATLTILSQHKGRKDQAGLKTYLNAFVVLLFCLSNALGLLGVFLARPILIFLDTPSTVMSEAVIYLQINCAGVVFLFGYNFIGTVMRALGDSRTPMHFVVVAVLLNLVLDPLFIAGFGWGIQGAALATVLSQGAALIYGVVIIYRRKLAPYTRPFIPAKEPIKLILKLGIPAGFQMAVIAAGSAAIMSAVNFFGEHAVAGFGAAQRIDSLIMLPAMALGSAVNSMAGQNIGASKWDRVYSIGRRGVAFVLAIMIVLAVVMFSFAEGFIRMFVDDPATIQFGTTYLQSIAFFYPFLGINFVLNGIIRASGAMYQVLVLNIVSFWVLRYPLTELCAYFVGEQGIALGMGLSFVASSIVASSYYKFGKWNRKELLHNNPSLTKQ